MGHRIGDKYLMNLKIKARLLQIDEHVRTHIPGDWFTVGGVALTIIILIGLAV